MRVALWLLQEVGEGNIFTKAELRSAFPGVEQVDRRMRDLRSSGWTILTYLLDPTLTAEELRFTKAGSPVWESGATAASHSSFSSKERQAIFARDGYMCVYCGIAGGESYSDALHDAAVLTVSSGSGTGASGGLTVCRKCKQDSPATRAEQAHVEQLLKSLSTIDRSRLRTWLSAGRRVPSDLDQIYAFLRRLPAGERDLFLSRLDESP